MGRQRSPRKPKPPVGDVRDPDSLYHHMLRYLAFLEERNYSLQTVRNRDIGMRVFIEWCFERALTKPVQIDRPILERYQRHLFYYRKANGDPLSVRTQHMRLNPLQYWFQWLVKQGHLLYSPAADLVLPRIEKCLPKAILTAKEAEAVLAVPDLGNALGLRDRAILETLYSTGMRRMEVAGLTVYSVERERGTVMIRQGKGKKDRVVPIGERAMLWIEKYLYSGRPELVAGRDDGTLFLTNTGEPFLLDRLSELVRGYVEKSGVRKKGACHLFRHTMATLMLENGADIRYIQAMLGHVSLETTQIYTQVSIRHLKDIHTATHPAKLPEAAQHRLEAEPTAEALLEALSREAEEDGED
jgi:integrase/recombinase XerD